MHVKLINAFRARLVRDGYKDVSIYCDGYGSVHVYASKDGKRFRKLFAISSLDSYPKKVYFDEEF